MGDRARAKSENDYFAEAFPTSAAVLDFNRCLLVFKDIRSLLFALDFFVKKVYGYAAGAIIGIVRSKNGFKEYVSDGPRYADIKLNVLIRGNHNLIGEVQFLLSAMSSFKARAHNLYAIQREEEFMQSAATILPSLIDKKQQLKVAAVSGNTKALCSVMMFGNMS